jgi:tight adherence protein B
MGGVRARGRLAEFSRDDAVELCGRLAALSLAGLPPGRAWQVLAEGRGPAATVARTVAGMVAVGGPAADGLRLAAGRTGGPGVEALHWLAVTVEVVERSGAPAALVFERAGEGLLTQITGAQDREVALAGPRATATVLATLPLAGLLLGPLAGSDPLGVLLGTRPGWACAVAGGLLWVTGRRWSRRLVRAAARAGT